MTASRKVLMVIGSPRGRESVSQALADFLEKKLRSLSVSTESLRVASPVRTAGTVERSHEMMDSADAIVLIFPLYVDQLPSGVVKLLEDYSLHRKISPPAKAQSLMVVVNNGFPEARQNDHAVAVVRRFAEQGGFGWLGGVTLGAGGMIPPGDDLYKAGGRAFKIRAALEATALCLSGVWKGPIPEAVLQEIRKPVVPGWLYRFFAGWGFKWDSWKNGVRLKMKARPYFPGPKPLA